ncbi:hypothetical protein ZOSMA_171G00440 [Zostera marina]|uniref:Uncharacterized protein n=1 Tax=Zostera marina TaxID=29655 RepID=A0A0K9PSN1_ZOSMR|nr:hypothetical protein ZOSMA_171G00440 [Zostera marina]
MNYKRGKTVGGTQHTHADRPSIHPVHGLAWLPMKKPSRDRIYDLSIQRYARNSLLRTLDEKIIEKGGRWLPRVTALYMIECLARSLKPISVRA